MLSTDAPGAVIVGLIVVHVAIVEVHVPRVGRIACDRRRRPIVGRLDKFICPLWPIHEWASGPFPNPLGVTEAVGVRSLLCPDRRKPHGSRVQGEDAQRNAGYKPTSVSQVAHEDKAGLWQDAAHLRNL